MAYKRIEVDGDIEILNVYDGDYETDTYDGEYGSFQPVSHQNIYTGATEVTPSEEEQILATTDKLITTDIVVRPIPQNYGLITWDGHHLTVS